MLWGAAVFMGLWNAGPAAAQTRKTVWDGVFTAEQAARGKTMFASACAACHGPDLNGVNGPALKGEAFVNHWMEGSLDAWFARVKSMPPNRANLGGPAPVPSFALVDVVGCLARGPNDTWMLTNGSEPARTRSPMQPTESEIAAARAKPLGSQKFQLLDVEYFSNAFHPEAHAGHQVDAKGFLIRSGTDVRINVTWVEMLAADCGR